jgi:hypothetical protein
MLANLQLYPDSRRDRAGLSQRFVTPRSTHRVNASGAIAVHESPGNYRLAQQVHSRSPRIPGLSIDGIAQQKHVDAAIICRILSRGSQCDLQVSQSRRRSILPPLLHLRRLYDMPLVDGTRRALGPPSRPNILAFRTVIERRGDVHAAIGLDRRSRAALGPTVPLH